MNNPEQVIPIDGAAKLILEKDDASRKVITVPEWDDVEIELRSISVDDRSKLFTKWNITALEKFGANPDAIIFIFVRGTFDVASGKPLFGKDTTTARLLLTKRPDVLDNIVRQILELSGMVKGADVTVEKN